MDELLNDKLKTILSDPDSLKSILSIAQAFGGMKGETSDKNASESSPANEDEDVESSKTSDQTNSHADLPIRSSDLSLIGRDDRVNLLLSIKPFLNEKKKNKVDSLIKALGAAKLISTYKDLDIFSKFGL